MCSSVKPRHRTCMLLHFPSRACDPSFYLYIAHTLRDCNFAQGKLIRSHRNPLTGGELASMTPTRFRLARTLCQQGQQRWMQTCAQSECGMAAAIRAQVSSRSTAGSARFDMQHRCAGGSKVLAHAFDQCLAHICECRNLVCLALPVYVAKNDACVVACRIR